MIRMKATNCLITKIYPWPYMYIYILYDIFHERTQLMNPHPNFDKPWDSNLSHR